MKLGIDINNSEITIDVVEKLKNEGHYVIDMSVVNSKNIGDRLHKKVILANSSKIDFYINLSMDNVVSLVEIYYKESENTKKFCSLFIDRLVDYEVEEKGLKCGEELYLIKNILAPTVVIKIGELKDKVKASFIAENIVYSLLNAIEKNPLY